MREAIMNMQKSYYWKSTNSQGRTNELIEIEEIQCTNINGGSQNEHPISIPLLSVNENDFGGGYDP
ncbi:hypothetical protein [Algicola sagamiensis]|uniref:hypothetical protein n=1 Tax=Algicola sagamiensis TaxID=163869 RepID=UPI00035FCEA1|nr:hypothetical protein [Algicola sagamiensis]